MLMSPPFIISILIFPLYYFNYKISYQIFSICLMNNYLLQYLCQILTLSIFNFLLISLVHRCSLDRCKHGVGVYTPTKYHWKRLLQRDRHLAECSHSCWSPSLLQSWKKGPHKAAQFHRQNHPPPNILTKNKTIRMLTFLAVKTTHLAITGAPGAVQPPLRRLTQRILTFLGSWVTSQQVILTGHFSFMWLSSKHHVNGAPAMRIEPNILQCSLFAGPQVLSRSM